MMSESLLMTLSKTVVVTLVLVGMWQMSFTSENEPEASVVKVLYSYL